MFVNDVPLTYLQSIDTLNAPATYFLSYLRSIFVTTCTTSLRFPQISLHRDCPHSTNRPAAPWLRQKQSNGTSIYWLQESIWLHRPWSPSNETECLWDMWPWTRLPTQQSEWTQTVRSHWRMSLPPMNCNGWSTTREHTGLHYVSPVQQRPTLSNSAFYHLYLCRWHHFQFLIRRDRWNSWHHINPSTRPRWPFTVVGCQQDGHERRRDEMSLSDRETPYK